VSSELFITILYLASLVFHIFPYSEKAEEEEKGVNFVRMGT
jgi:hypothetical protein